MKGIFFTLVARISCLKILSVQIYSSKIDVGGYLTVSFGKEERKFFPGNPVVKTLPSNSGSKELIPGKGAKILCLT